MEQIHTANQQVRTDNPVVRVLAVLVSSLLLGAWMVWQLRQDWAKEQPLAWLPFLLAMFGAAYALRRLDLWLPGQPTLPSLENVSSKTYTILGWLCIGIALALTGIIAQHLYPDYRKLWHGIPLFWLIAMSWMIAGAWMLGAVGRASPRAATASALWSDSPRSRWLEAAAFLLILLLAVFLRTYRIHSIPSGIYVDETNASMDALYILEGRDVSPFATGWYETQNGFIFFMAGIFKLLGANWISLKLISLIPSILTIIAIYFLGRLVFGPAAGLYAMLFLAVSRWHLSMSRWGWNETAPPFFQILAAFFLIRGLRDRRAVDYALSGILMSLSFYTYLSARLAAATLLLYILYWILSDPSGIRAAMRRSWLGFVIFACAALVAITPLAITYITNPYTMNNRVAEISIFKDVREQGSIKPFIQNITDILKFFHQTGDHQGKHNLPDEPMADPITGLFFAIGLAYSILRWRDQRYAHLLLWLVIGLAGSYLSSHHESPQSYRSLTALPAVILMAADMLDRVTRALYKTLHENAAGVSSQRSAYIAGAFAVLMLTGATAWESNVYFGRQASSVAVERGFNPMENKVAHEVINALQAGKEVYLSPKFSEFSQLRFLVYGVVKSQTGANTLDDRPYQTVLPESDLPIPDTDKDVLMLLDISYWHLRDYIAAFYPNASFKLITLSDESPVYFRVEIPREQVAALQGLVETVKYADGRSEQLAVTGVQVEPEHQQATQIEWDGSIRVEHGGEYEIQGQGGLDVLIDNLPVNGKQYFGRGVYGLKVVWNAGDSTESRLRWKTSNQDWAPVPVNILFRSQGGQQGLLATYWNNTNWENTPMFHQVTPFLLLAWNQEQPIVPNGPFSARYAGFLNTQEPGSYTFRIEADDGARLLIDGNILAEAMTPGQPNNFDVTLNLQAGSHPIQIDYFQQGGGSALRLFWKHDDQPFTPVPPSALTPAQP